MTPAEPRRADWMLEVGIGQMAHAGHGNGNHAHFGAALVAAWWLERDSDLDTDVVAAIGSAARQMMDATLERFPDDEHDGSAACSSDELVTHLAERLEDVFAIAHDVIFTALALRTFAERPELCTTATVEGMHRLIDWCRQRPLRTIDVGDVGNLVGSLPVVVDASVVAPPAGAWPEWTALVTDTMAGFPHIYVGLHQGHVGHLLDHCHALYVLDTLGYHDLATAGLAGLSMHVVALRNAQELVFDYPAVASGPVADPLTAQYWEVDRRASLWTYGHTFKYPYALLPLQRIAPDDAVRTMLGAQLGRLL